MAVPTITSVTPTTGPAHGRNVLTIVGTNFALQPTQPVTGPGVSYGPRVRVVVDGIECDVVQVESAALLRVSVPPFSRTGADAAADPIPRATIQVLNLDGSGDPIGGEAVSLANAYRYVRSKIRPPDATHQQQIYQRVIRETTEMFVRQVLANTSIGTNVDYGDDGVAVIKAAELPCISLIGPRMVEDMTNRHHWSDFLEVVQDAGPPAVSNRRWPGFLAQMQFDVMVASNSRLELYGLVQGCTELFLRNPYVRIPYQVGEPNGPHHQFPLHLEQAFNVTVQDAASNLVSAVATFTVRHIPMRIDDTVDTVHEVLDGTLESGQVAGGDPEPAGSFADQD